MSNHEFVRDLPDLIDAAEYDAHPDGQLIRFQIRVAENGVVLLGDAFRPAALESILNELGGGPTEQMLCG
jgi:hypothetical protein